MAINGNLLNAILSMDVYNRGYAPGIKFHEAEDTENQLLGNLTIKKQSDIDDDTSGVKAGFYGLSYAFDDGQTIIAYRGTDDDPQFETSLNLRDFRLLFQNPLAGALNLSVKLFNSDVEITPDVWNGWFVGMGNDQSAQAIMAHEFYKDVVGGVDNVLSANISLTGHSLGGGLAGFVGGTYRKDATVFDQMPYEKAIENQWAQLLDPNSPEYSQQLKDILFGNNNAVSPGFLDHFSYSIDGEALSLIRDADTTFGAIVTSTIPETSFDLGAAFDAHQATLSESERLTPTQLHSQSLLVTRMFFDQEDSFNAGASIWDPAGAYLWPVLFDKSFAQSIGVDVLEGELKNKGDFDGILRSIIAYSAIDEGDASARPFGDTAIRALYDDANDLGAALGGVGAGNVLEQIATDISKVFVHFAGQLALNKLERGDYDHLVVLEEGVLDYTAGGNVLGINVGDSAWGIASQYSSEHEMVSRDGLLASLGVEPTDLDTRQLEKIVFATRAGAVISIEEPTYSSNITLFVGSEQQDGVIGSVAVDHLMGSLGDDVLNGGGGARDVLDYSLLDQSVSVELSGNVNFDFVVRKGLNDQDDVTGVEMIIGSDFEYDTINIDESDIEHYFKDDNGDLMLRFNGFTDGYNTGSYFKFRGFEGFGYTDDIDVVSISSVENILHDGLNGDDVINYSSGNMVASGGDLYVYDDIGDDRDQIINFETVLLTNFQPFGNWGKIVVDETVGSLNELPVRTFTHSNSGVWNDVIPTGTHIRFHELDYSSVSSSLTFDFRQVHSYPDNPPLLIVELANVSGAGINHTFLSANAVYGTNHGDTFYVASLFNGGTNSVNEIHTGTGNDRVINLVPNPTDRTDTIHYNGGHDKYEVGVGSRIVMDSRITLNDVDVGAISSSGNLSGDFSVFLRVEGHGSISIDFDGFAGEAGVSIEFESGGNITFQNPYYVDAPHYRGWEAKTTGTTTPGAFDRFYIDGSWGEDKMAGDERDEVMYGYGGDDVINAGVGADFINGGEGHDTLLGGDGEDGLKGGYGDDHLYGQTDNDNLDGSFGVDTAYYSSAFANYTLSFTGLSGTVTANVGDEGVDTLKDIEFLEFSDGRYDVENATFSGETTDTAPIAFGETYVTDEDSSVSGNVLSNDLDLSNSSLSVIASNIPTANGSVVLLANGDFTYTPNAGYFGIDGFSYTIENGNGSSDTATVNISVQDAPSTGPDALIFDAADFTSYSGGQDTNGGVSVSGDGSELTISGNAWKKMLLDYEVTADTVIEFDYRSTEEGELQGFALETDNDYRTGPQIIQLYGRDGHGQFDRSYDYNGSGEWQSFSINASAYVTGLITALAFVNDDDRDSDAVSMYRDFKIYEAGDVPANTNPVAQDDSVVTDEDTAIIVNALGNDSDADSDPLSVTAVTQAAHGSVVINGDNTLTYTPDADFNGADSFTYTVDDGQGGSDTAIVNVSVDAVNDNPEASEDVAVVDQDSSVVITLADLLANDGDVDGDALSVISISNAVNGAAHLSAGQHVTFTPDAGFFGIASFDYTVSDGNGGSDTVSVSITVNEVIDDVPDALVFDVADFTSYSAGQDTNGGVSVSGDGSELTISGNAWKKMLLDYTVTADTVIEFDYRSTEEGELQGFALETDNDYRTGPQIIQLYGRDGHGQFDRSHDYNGSGDWQSFSISASDYVTGAITHLAFVNDDDRDSDAVSMYRDFIIYERDTSTPVVDPLDLGAAMFNEYSDQNIGFNDVQAVDTRITMDGNAWMAMSYSLTVTENSYLSFEFSSDMRGEIHAIGFDTDNDLSTGDGLIKLYGTQNWGKDGPDYAGDGGVQSFVIKLSDFYDVGSSYTQLVFANDDDANKTANSVFDNVRIYEDDNLVEPDPEPVVPSTPPVDLGAAALSEYSSQNIGFSEFDANADQLDLEGNIWLKMDYNYTVTADSYISFDYSSSVRGEIHAIGLDTDNSLSTGAKLIKIYGTQEWGQGNLDYDGSGDVESYVLKLSDYYTIGTTYTKLVFANDDDGNETANGTFNNVRLFEFDATPSAQSAQSVLEGDAVLYATSDVLLSDDAPQPSFVATSTDGDLLFYDDLMSFDDPVDLAIADFVAHGAADDLESTGYSASSKGVDYIDVFIPPPITHDEPETLI